ncbi:MAG: hypothetical protein P1P84_08560 [Deferrisomatales bacterium]|nr:hypothetical protein [Deferrisomatales bacterium]
MGVSRAVLLLMAVVFLAAGCAPTSITLQPGKTEWGAAQEGGGDAWSLWVADVKDLRSTAAAEGAKVGLLYPNYQTEPQTAYLAPEPTRYVRDELSRFLLHRGLEASEGRRAKLHLRLELTDFSLVEKPGAVMDEIRLRVEYTVRFVAPQGAELGSLRLEGSRMIQTPISTRRKAEEGFRDAVSDTFAPLLASDVFVRAMNQVR